MNEPPSLINPWAHDFTAQRLRPHWAHDFAARAMHAARARADLGTKVGRMMMDLYYSSCIIYR